MPAKTCPVCGATYGSRKLVCNCGHDFGCKRPKGHAVQSVASPVFPEPGEWIWEKPKGFPAIERPDPLPAGPLDDETIRTQVRYDGLGFCVWSLIPARRIKEKKLRLLWWEARKAMEAVVDYLAEDGFK